MINSRVYNIMQSFIGISLLASRAIVVYGFRFDQQQVGVICLGRFINLNERRASVVIKQ